MLLEMISCMCVCTTIYVCVYIIINNFLAIHHSKYLKIWDNLFFFSMNTMLLFSLGLKSVFVQDAGTPNGELTSTKQMGEEGQAWSQSVPVEIQKAIGKAIIL